jgi:centrin-3
MLTNLRAVSERILARDPMEEIRRAFQLFDDDNTGKISIRNLRRVAKEIGDRLEDDELCVPSFSSPCRARELTARRQAMIDEFDLDQDGEIDEKEFIAIMTDDA